jgi:ubiquinone/menaquinone biosynthesis C-methylase UbiE
MKNLRNNNKKFGKKQPRFVFKKEDKHNLKLPNNHFDARIS